MLKAAPKPAWQASEFDKPIVVASYFGFQPIAAPRVSEADLKASEHCLKLAHFDAAEKAALIRTYMEENLAEQPHPLALIYKRKAGLRAKPASGSYGLHYIGAASAVAEAALIRATLSVLAEEGHQNMRVELNCIGDKDSLASYERELLNYIKKHGGTLSADAREALREDVFNIFRHTDEEMIEFRQSAPSSLAYLTSASRAHFKEVLEFVEGLGIEFGLEPSLVGEKNHASHTVFGIRSSGLEAELTSPAYLAVGYRYSRLSKRLGLRKEIPMASCTIYSQEKAAPAKLYKELPRAKFYLVQLGREAKVRSLGLIETLRRERVPVYHFLGKDKLSIQLQSAEDLHCTHLIIIGHKEALDGTATVRNIATRAQDTIPLSTLPDYLKHIKL
jgi:histidyl-tRNA synthetase